MNKAMCTYNISIDDSLIERVRPAFSNNAAIGFWMQSQIEIMLQEMASKVNKEQPKMLLSQKLRGIAAHAPKDFDYKRELEKRY